MRRAVVSVAVLVALLVVVAGCGEREGTLSPAGIDEVQFAKQNPNPGPVPDALPMNLSFPIMWTSTDSLSLLLLDPYILKTESITKVYTGTYPGMTEEEIAYLEANEPWYPQPPYANENTWVAEYLISDAMHEIHFIDWGNPMENIVPRVGQRFPVEMALYERVGYAEFDELGEIVGFVGTTMEPKSCSSEASFCASHLRLPVSVSPTVIFLNSNSSQNIIPIT